MGRINLNLKVGPVKEPVGIDMMRIHLRMDGTDEDVYVEEVIIPSARASIEEALSMGLITQTWEWYWDGGFPNTGVLVFPIGPVLSVTSVKYLDTDGVEATLSSSKYTVAIKSDVQRLWLNESEVWPDVDIQRPEVAWVEFKVGYGTDPDDVPAKVRHLVMLMGEHIFEHRGPVLTGGMGAGGPVQIFEVPKTLDYLINQIRVLDFSPTATTQW